MRSPVFIALVSTLLLAGSTLAQPQSDLDRLDEKFTRYFERVLPGWKHERVEPVWKGENVLIQFWSLSNRKVKISVLPHKSGEEAREALESFVQSEWNKQPLRDFGDEAFTWGYGLSNVAFRRGRLTIYVSTYADVDSDSDARTLSQEQRFEREKNEMRRLSREFAKHGASAIDAP
jgi:hypothetical protein